MSCEGFLKYDIILQLCFLLFLQKLFFTLGRIRGGAYSEVGAYSRVYGISHRLTEQCGRMSFILIHITKLCKNKINRFSNCEITLSSASKLHHNNSNCSDTNFTDSPLAAGMPAPGTR